MIFKQFFITRLAAVGLMSITLMGCVAPVSKQFSFDDRAIEQEAKKQRIMALENRLGMISKIQTLSYPILQANADLCEDRVTKTLGLYFTSLHDFDKSLTAAGKEIGYSGRIQISEIIQGGPAHLAGLRVGDRILSINEKAIPPTKKARNIVTKTLRAAESHDIKLAVKRGNERLFVQAEAVDSCDYPVFLGESSEINAFATGDSIVIQKGMISFAQQDLELRLVIAHELAHNMMGHIEASTINHLGGVLLDSVLIVVSGIDFGARHIAMDAYSQEFEAEADYVGIYLLERAGFDSTGSADFWRKMGASGEANIKGHHTHSHPATPYRFLAIKKASEEVRIKKAQGLPLIPDLKEE
ncbi:MAG: M48 family metalloprotease [Alphaproteobacteria bacterium]